MEIEVVLNISQDDNEEDTSGDDLEDDSIKEENLNVFLEQSNTHPLFSQFMEWKRPSHNLNSYRPQLLQQQPPDISHTSDKKCKLKFWLMDVDTWASSEINPFNSQVETIQPIHSVMRMYGLDERGNSICCFVHGFSSYFWAIPSENFSKEDIPNFKDCLNHAILMEMKKDLNSVQFLDFINDDNPPVSNVEYFENPSRLNIFEFHEPKTTSARTRSIYETPTKKSGETAEKNQSSSTVALKIHCVVTKFLHIAAKVLKRGLVFYPFVNNPCQYDVFEDTLNPTIRFLTSLNLSCCTWLDLELTIGNFYNRDFPPHSDKYRRQSYATVELDIDYKELQTQIIKHHNWKAALQEIEEKEEEEPLPTLRILSFDIECMTRPPNFSMPQGGNDRVLQIGNVLKVRTATTTVTHKSEDTISTVKVVFTLGSCDEIPGAHVFSFDDEISLLEAWRLFLIVTDPDILTGYNIIKFDIPFLLDRAVVLGSKKFPYFGRTINTSASTRPILNQLKRMNKWADRMPLVQGRIVFDLYPIMKENFRTSQPFTLANMSKTFLEFEEKGDVKYTEIFKLQNLSSATRNRLATYCLQDAWLALKLMLKTGKTERKEPQANNDSEPSNENENSDDESTDSEDLLSFYCQKATSSGSLRYLVTKSPQYNQYFKLVRKQKNPSHIFPHVSSITPWKRRPPVDPQTALKREKVRKMLFTENDEQEEQSI